MAKLFQGLTDEQRADLMIAGDLAEDIGLAGATELLRAVAGEEWKPCLHPGRRPVWVEGQQKQVYILDRPSLKKLEFFAHPASGESAGIFDHEESNLILNALGKLGSEFGPIETVRWLYQVRLNLIVNGIYRVIIDKQPVRVWKINSIDEREGFNAQHDLHWKRIEIAMTQLEI